MSCTSDVCGTGDWSGPKPGDPDNNAVLSANGVFGGIEVSWTYPNTNSHAVAHTLLYRSIGDRFETAIQVAIVSGNRFFDRETTNPIQTYYYWIRFVSINGTLMQPIGPATGYALDDLDRVITGMAGRIEAGALSTPLRLQIDKIVDLEADITNLSQTIINESGILSQTLQGVQSDIDDALAYYEQERDARLLADGALATVINTTVAQAKDELYSAVQESVDAQALVNGDLSSKYSVKVDLAGNVAGFGLASSGNVYDETIHSEFGVQADSFWVSGPSTVSATAPLTNLYHGRVWVDTSDAENPVTKYYNKTTGLWQTTVVKGAVPFVVRSSPDPVTGALAGVYIDSAYISTITANQIDTRGLSIKDQDGNVILAAGTSLDWSKIAGQGKPADGATVGATFGVNIGGQITPGNISTYIASAAIDTAYIADAAITQAKIGNLAVGSAQIADAAITTAKIGAASITTANIGDAQVNTLQLAGQAVTIPVSAYTSGNITIPGSTETTVQSVSLTSTGAPIFLLFTANIRNGDVLVEAGDSDYYSPVPTEIRIYRGATRIQTTSFSESGAMAVTIKDTAGAGSVTYYAKAYSIGGTQVDGSSDAVVSARSLFLLETKR